MKQKYSSKNTSLNQIPKAMKLIDIFEGRVILDYGCGGYNKSKEYVESQGGIYYGYDPYWKSEEENIKALMCNPDIIVCANVLNVIMEDEIIEGIVETLANYETGAMIQVYEGDKSGIGTPTTKGYQRNAKAETYIPLLKRHFETVIKKGNIFLCY